MTFYKHLYRALAFGSGHVTALKYCLIINIIIHINILNLGLINTGFDIMSIIQRFKNSTYLAVVHLKGDHLFRERAW